MLGRGRTVFFDELVGERCCYDAFVDIGTILESLDAKHQSFPEEWGQKAPNASCCGVSRGAHRLFTAALVAAERFLDCPGPPGRSSALSIFHSELTLYGVFVRAHRVLNSR